MPAVAATSSTTRCHCSMGSNRCAGFSIERSTAPLNTGATVCSGGRTTMCAWLPRVWATRLLCSDVIKHERKMSTATPTPAPPRINKLCARPSRKKRTAMCSGSDGGCGMASRSS